MSSIAVTVESNPSPPDGVYHFSISVTTLSLSSGVVCPSAESLAGLSALDAQGKSRVLSWTEVAAAQVHTYRRISTAA